MALLDPKHYFVPDVHEVEPPPKKEDRPQPRKLPSGCLLYRFPTTAKKPQRRRKNEEAS